MFIMEQNQPTMRYAMTREEATTLWKCTLTTFIQLGSQVEFHIPSFFNEYQKKNLEEINRNRKFIFEGLINIFHKTTGFRPVITDDGSDVWELK